ncbi:Cell cycle checkpoint control protein RAD9A, partial [Linum perenne]
GWKRRKRGIGSLLQFFNSFFFFPLNRRVKLWREMEFSLSGNALKAFSRCITCLGRIGNELAVQASSSQLAFHTLNSSRSAYQTITFKPGFFDVYAVFGAQVKFSVLVKAVCSVLRTPVQSIDHLRVQLVDPDSSKVQWTLECNNGMRKAYSITCNVESDIQHLALDRNRYPSSFTVRPRDLNKLLANFQSTLQEITIIATEITSLPSDAASQIGGKAVELRSYIDPTKDNDSSLHTQLWIDPTEEFIHYTHAGDPVDITFSVKELKAFVSFCESCEVDIHLYFEKAGEPIIMAPRFVMSDASGSNFDATLVLATMITSQLHDDNASEPVLQPDSIPGQAVNRDEPRAQSESSHRASVSDHPSDHTKIWSDLSGSGARSGSGVEARETNLSATDQRQIQRISTIHISENVNAGVPAAAASRVHQKEKGLPEEAQANDTTTFSQRHPSNWVDATEADDDEDDLDENEMCIQSTPPYYEEH